MAVPTNSGICHVAAIPYPGRGHVNPMMNLCKLISLRRPFDFLVTFIVTEEWLGFIESEPKPTNIQFATIPNVIPSEMNRGNDFYEFFKATQRNMEYPVEQLLHRMKIPVNVIIFDSYLISVLDIGRRMNIAVASLFTMSAAVFSMCSHYDLLVQNGHVGDDVSEKVGEIVDYIPGVPPIRVADLVTGFNGKGKEVMPLALPGIFMSAKAVDYIPGVPPIRVADLVTGFNGKGKEVMPLALPGIFMSAKAQFLLFASTYELESQVIDALKSDLSIPVYAIGPAIPYSSLNEMENAKDTPDYVKWLDRQPEDSVLYISQGSFLSVSNAQLDEIIAGVHDSGVRYMWIARGETSRFQQDNEEKGLVIPWCEQLRVLCHSSIGGFWSHCGWNSTKEGAFSGVPMLTFPIFWDQVPNSKMIVEDWKMGKRVRIEDDTLVTREEIAKIITSFMDQVSEEGKEMRKRAREVKKICRRAIEEEGSAQTDIDSFIDDISKSRIQ